MKDDPYKYFRTEARELIEGLTQGVLDIEKGHAAAEVVSRLLRYAHTLKGAARIVKQTAISELSHSIEEVLAALRDKPQNRPADAVRQLLASIDGITSELARLGQSALAASPQPAPRVAADAGDEQLETIRVDMKDMDALLRTVSELRVQMAGLSRLAPELGRAARQAGDNQGLENTLRDVHRNVSAALDRSDREIESLCEQAEAMRLVPANSVFGVLERTARDAADATGKRVAFEAGGGETRLDARGLRLLRNALIHLVRNAVSHGIESPAERAAAGKPAAGRVQIRVERRGDRAVFACEDDGRGVDVERVRQVIVERKLATPSEALELTPATAVALLLRGGITTTRSVSQLSGRGVGLEVARAAVAAVNGSVMGTTSPGKGTRIEMSVPVMVESQEVLHVQAGSTVASVPLQAVSQTVRLTPAEIAVSPEGQTIVCNGRAVRYAPLARFLKNGQAHGPGGLSALVIESPTGLAALGVDHILDRERVVIRALPQILGPIPTISGAFLDSDGSPQLVLNPDGLVQAIGAISGMEEQAAPERPRLLVIDDSLTTRMLEQAILETAGYEVDTASSGEEALEKARQRRYGVFIVDVEMPGMDGFQFIQAASAVPELSAVPSIVVTSRSAAEDRARGAAVGAKAFIVKSEFDEALLLKTIRELVGEP
ncbi:MAG: response regulator [Verrucomicrobia bacterium]|nr:response regulator [Verrucomicrobiota bacterium]